MKKGLAKTVNEIWHFKNGKKISGCHDRIFGDVSGISGDVSRISGNVSGISGDATNVTGNIEDCEITEEERKKGVRLNDLIINHYE